jgi:kinesin family protein 6/9
MSKDAKKQADANIQTFLRIRPSKKTSGFFSLDEADEESLKFNLPENLKLDFVNNSKLRHNFHFNGIIDMKSTQEDVFKKVGVAAVQNAIDGFNSTIFAYGQTGSGKTFTLTVSCVYIDIHVYVFTFTCIYVKSIYIL